MLISHIHTYFATIDMVQYMYTYLRKLRTLPGHLRLVDRMAYCLDCNSKLMAVGSRAGAKSGHLPGHYGMTGAGRKPQVQYSNKGQTAL